MSGSPILADNGSAIGIVCTSCSVAGSAASTEGGPNPRLASHLPGWLLQEIGLFHIRRAHALGEHLKPAINDHFKTGQRSRTQDMKLF